MINKDAAVATGCWGGWSVAGRSPKFKRGGNHVWMRGAYLLITTLEDRRERRCAAALSRSGF